MITLFKKRTFSDLLSDSFNFFKLEGKHFFKNYFIVNGIFLLLLIVLSYFLFQVYFEALTSGMASNGNSGYNFAEKLFNNNFGLIVGGAIFFAVLMLFITLLNFAYPVIYLKLYEKNNGNNFQISDIVKELKSKIGKMFLFFLLSLVTIFPLIVILLLILVLLSFLIIGIPLLIITFPLLFSLMSLSLYEYLNNDSGFFNVIGKAFSYIFKQFWPILGSTIIIYIIIQTVMTIVSMIPYFIGMISIFSTIEENPNSQETFSTLGILMIVVFIISILANYILHNLLMINQGMIYYSIREKIENKSSFSDIDSIGTNFE